jgi:GH15 family glucan-1,4-alpha-glucosidase
MVKCTAFVRPEYRPIADYAAIGDCRSAALVSRDGSVDWLCWPHFGSESVFAAILDRRRGGFFQVCAMNTHTVRRRYVPETNVLETLYDTDSGVLRLTDVMTLGTDWAARLEPQRELLRILEVVQGCVAVAIRYVPRPGYGERSPRLSSYGGRAIVHRSSDALLCLHSTVPLELDRQVGAAEGSAILRATERHYLSLSFTSRDIGTVPLLGEAAEERRDRTVQWWEEWSRKCQRGLPFEGAVLRSALTLKMLSYALSGAIVAAPTTSLPEAIGSSRNWDYRFCWLRDASLTLRAFMDLGYRHEARAFLDWLLHTTQLYHPHLNVLYDLYGRTSIHESQLDWLEGYRHSRPVRTGNGAASQLQLDVHGAVCLAALAYVERGGELEFMEKRLLASFGKFVARHWREPDNGIWEGRGGRRQHTYSKLMCWAAADSLLQLDRRIGLPLSASGLRATREEIRRWIENRAFDPETGGFVAQPDNRGCDASLLAMARCGFVEASDPRMKTTFEIIERELSEGALVYRYPPGSDGLPGREGAFGLAGFWAVDYLARCGEVDRALRRFEALLEYANDVGLFSEEIEPANGEALGNFPQAFTHLGLITAAQTLERAMEARG